MSIEDKASAFDLIVHAFMNRWNDGKWSWFPLTPCGGKTCDTRSEATEDFLAWAERMGERNRKKYAALEVLA